MNKNLYSKLARNNIKNNRNTYFPYMFSSIIAIAMFNIMLTITNRASKAVFYGDSSMIAILMFGVNVIGLFSLLFIFYTNSFLLKRRTKELGLYSVLGMEKKHIVKVLFYEILYSGLTSIGTGIIVGLVFTKLMFVILLNLLFLDTSISLGISWFSIGVTILVFILIYLVVLVYNTIKIYRLNPIDLITGGKKGEREPKANWFLGLIGMISLGIGYYLALTINNPISALNMFFVAVLFVMIGTYLLFTSGSIIIIKGLRRNKKYYYQKNHFISVSNMIYRMKQNASGLSNIAILSTAVLITISTTISLYVGIEDVMRTRYPRDVNIGLEYGPSNLEDIENIIEEYGEINEIEVSNIENLSYSMIVGTLNKNEILGTGGEISFSDGFAVYLIPLEDYNRNQGLSLELEDGQVLFFSDTTRYNYEDIIVYGERYEIREKLEEIDFLPVAIFNEIVIIVKDIDVIENLVSKINEIETIKDGYSTYYSYRFDIEGKHEDKINFISSLKGKLNESVEGLMGVEDRYTTRQDFISLYGSLFFIGIFLGSLFMIATVLIIYYKQISEGYDDRERFTILQKVGMSKEEVKRTIKSQILMVFFLPLVTAIIHTVVAFPLVSKILAVLNLTNTRLFLSMTAIVVLIFTLGYGIVYKWTARVYYRIVN
ncbi:MAG: ABC transporter permease [Tissierellia bacterium]|nr:ABC transporter permease [Tissierellia bacterium]